MRSFVPCRKNERGFTLIEILVATAVLAFASMLTYQAILGSFNVNRKLTRESDSFLSISIAMQAMERDVGQLFSPQIGASTPPADNTPEAYWSAIQREDGLRRTRFTGTKEKMSFVSASNRRLQAEVKETELLRITYRIVQEKDGTYSVVRVTDADAYAYEKPELNETEVNGFKILEGLTSATFGYYRGDKTRWEEQWDSEAPYTDEASRFPDIVAIEVQYPSPDSATNILKWRSEFMPILKLNGEAKAGASVGGETGTGSGGQKKADPEGENNE